MKNTCTTFVVKTLVFTLLLLSVNSFAQIPSTCHTMDYFDMKAPVDDFPFYQVTENGLQRATGTWSLNGGYGTDGNSTACSISDCSITSGNGRLPQAQSCDADPCGNGTGVYLVPIKITIFQDDDGSNQAVNVDYVRNQIVAMNTFHCCQGIPIQFYEITASPVFVQHTVQNNGGIQIIKQAYDESEYYNILVTKDTGNGTGCNGYAYLPSNVGTPGLTVMSGACFTASSISDPCTNTQIGVVLFHETGHSLGLYHTHTGAGTGVNDEFPDGTNCCSSGDYICDTDADPRLNNPCAAGTGCDKDPSGCPAPNGGTNGSYPTDINTEDNIMSYNHSGSCRQTYTDCQKAKMVDALICARPYCDPDLSRYFSNVSNANFEICVGDPIPSFSVDLRTCIQWYDAASGGNNIGSGATPNIIALPSIVNTAVSGSYKVYFEDNNDYNDCRKAVTIIVLSDSGDGVSTNTQCVLETDVLNLSTNNTQLGIDEITAWWITANSPIFSSISSQVTLNTALSGATIDPANDGSFITGSPSLLFRGNTITGGLATDCSQMSSGVTYYATPVLSKERAFITDAMCSIPIPVTPSSSSKLAKLPAEQIPCFPTTHTSIPTFTITITIAGFTGTDLNFIIRSDGCPFPDLAATAGNTNGIYTFTETDFPSGLEPHLDGICIWAYESGTTAAEDMTMTVNLDITYPGISAIPFPTIDYNLGCYFGDAIPFICSDFEIKLLPADCADMTAPYDIEFDFLDPTPSPNFTISGLVSGTLPDDGVLSGAAGDGLVTIADAGGCETTIPITFPNVNFAGDASTVATALVGANTINTARTNSTTLSPNETVAWWITKTNPITNTVTSQALLDAQNPTILSADDGTSNMDNVVISDALVGADGLSIDCTNLMTGISYYATPFVALAESPAPTDFSASLVGQANISSTLNEMEVPVYQIPTTATLEKVCIQLDYNACESFATFNDLDMKLEYNGTTIVLEYFFTGVSATPQTFDICFVDDGTGYTGAGTACNAACFEGDFESDNSFTPFDTMDPNGTWTVIINDDRNASFYPCEINVSLEFDMPAFANVFPTAAYSSCLFGDPIEFSCIDGAQLSPKVLLQGALSGTTMNTNITAMLPTTSPYTDNKTLSGAVPSNAVDWVWVEIRSDNTASPATVYAQSGILLDNGTVTEVNGISPLTFPTAPGQSWYVVIKHRNHLGVMTNAPVVIN